MKRCSDGVVTTVYFSGPEWTNSWINVCLLKVF